MKFNELEVGGLYRFGEDFKEYQLCVRNKKGQVDLIQSLNILRKRDIIGGDILVLNFSSIESVSYTSENYLGSPLRKYTRKDYTKFCSIDLNTLRELEQVLVKHSKSHYDQDSSHSLLNRQQLHGSFINGRKYILVLPYGFEDEYTLN